MDFTIQLKEKLPTLSKSQKQIAEFILEDPELFINQSIIVIGEQTKTSAPSVTRFAKKMGFDSIDALKISIAQDLAQIKQTHTLNPMFSPEDSLEELSEKTLDHIVTSLKITSMGFDYAQLEKVIDKIVAAKTTHVYGIGASGLAASDFYHKLSRSGMRATYNTDTHMAIEFSYHIDSQDVAIGISYSGRTKEVLIPLKQAKENGATSILITSSSDERLKEYADIIVRIARTEDLVRVGAISSKFTTMYLLDFIFLGILQHEFEHMESSFLATADLVAKIKNK